MRARDAKGRMWPLWPENREKDMLQVLHLPLDASESQVPRVKNHLLLTHLVNENKRGFANLGFSKANCAVMQPVTWLMT